MGKFIAKLLSTFFYIGYLPLIPGTFGSMAGVFLFYLVRHSLLAHVGLTLLMVIVGFMFSGQAERIFGKKDARYIVIDEVAGMLLALLFIPYDLKIVIIAFFLFRILDAFKPYPASILQELKGSLGIMADDLVAGLYTGVILQIALRLASLRAS